MSSARFSVRVHVRLPRVFVVCVCVCVFNDYHSDDCWL